MEKLSGNSAKIAEAPDSRRGQSVTARSDRLTSNQGIRSHSKHVAPPPLERLSPPRDSACHEYGGDEFHNHYRFALAEAFRARDEAGIPTKSLAPGTRLLAAPFHQKPACVARSVRGSNAFLRIGHKRRLGGYRSAILRRAPPKPTAKSCWRLVSPNSKLSCGRAMTFLLSRHTSCAIL